MIMKHDHIVSSLHKVSFCCSLIMMSCYPVLRQQVRIKDSGRLDEEERDNLTNAVRQTRIRKPTGRADHLLWLSIFLLLPGSSAQQSGL